MDCAGRPEAISRLHPSKKAVGFRPCGRGRSAPRPWQCIVAEYPQDVRLRLTELLLDSHWHVMRETRPLAQELTYLMQFDVRFGAPCDKAGNRIERDLDEAVELVFVHFIERYIHGASEIAL